MKKSIIFGIMAMFAMGALTVNAQESITEGNGKIKKETIKQGDEKPSSDQPKTKEMPAGVIKDVQKPINKEESKDKKVDGTTPAMKDVQRPGYKEESKDKKVDGTTPAVKDVQRPGYKEESKDKKIDGRSSRVKRAQGPKYKDESKTQKVEGQKTPQMKDKSKSADKKKDESKKGKKNIKTGVK